MTADVETMAYAGETPWHGLGTFVGSEPITNAQEMCRLAGMDWAIDCRPLYTCTASKDEGGRLVKVDGHYATMRMDRHEVLGVVGSRYEPIQNADLFSTLDSLTETGQMRYHTAGVLAGGRRVWALGKIGSHETVPGDRSDHFILAHSTHDGSGAFELLWTTVRVVCANTAAIALQQGRGDNRKMKLRHTANVGQRMAQARKALGIATARIDAHAEFERALAAASMNHAMWEQFAHALIPDPTPRTRLDAQGIMQEVRTSTARAESKRELLEELYQHGTGQDIPGVAGTLYAARNAVTEYVGYHRPTRGGDSQADKQEKRFESSLWGAGAAMVEQADNLLYEMLEAA